MITMFLLASQWRKYNREYFKGTDQTGTFMSLTLCRSGYFGSLNRAVGSI